MVQKNEIFWLHWHVMNGSVESRSWRKRKPDQNISLVSSKMSEEEKNALVADHDALIIEKVPRNGFLGWKTNKKSPHKRRNSYRVFLSCIFILQIIGDKKTLNITAKYI
jgi:hypothetical protein